jgi:uncharacterized protein YggE
MKKLILLGCLAFPFSVLAEGGLPDTPYIYVEGKAEIEKPADVVTLRFDLVGRNLDQARANQDVQAKATKVLALLNDKKIPRSDIIATDLTSEPEFETDEAGRRKGKIIRRSVKRRFEVKVRNLEIFAKLVDELIGIPDTEFTEITGALAKQKEAEDEIWRNALANAREQSEKTAKSMSVTVDSVFAISPKPFAQIRGDIFGADYGATRDRVTVTGPPEYLLGPMTISQTVHVIYLISPAK